MKKFFTILCATLLSVGVFAQAATEAGTFLISGGTGIDFASQSITGSDPSDYFESPGVDRSVNASSMNLDLLGGYFMMDGLAVGLGVTYTSDTEKEEESMTGYTNSDESTSTTMIIAPTLRYYLGETGAFFQTQYGFGTISSKYESTSVSGGVTQSNSYEDSNSMTMLSFGAGYAITLNDYISLNPSLGYAMSTVTIEEGYSTGNYNAVTGDPINQDLKINMSGMTFNLGIALHLGN